MKKICFNARQGLLSARDIIRAAGRSACDGIVLVGYADGVAEELILTGHRVEKLSTDAPLPAGVTMFQPLALAAEL
jgi:hypothetical protein